MKISKNFTYERFYQSFYNCIRITTPLFIFILIKVGLAIGDIEAVRNNAYIRMLRGQVRILEILERTYPNFLLKMCCSKREMEVVEKPYKDKSRWEK